MNSLGFGVSQSSIDSTTIATQTGTAYALPSPAAQLAWQVVITGTPVSITILLEGSLDNTTWFTLDSTSVVTGALRSINTPVAFVRARVSAISAGTTSRISVTFLARGYAVSNYSSGLMRQATLSLTNAQIKAIHTTQINIIPNPGPGRIIVPTAAWFLLDTVAAVYAVAGSAALQLITTTGGWAWFNLTGFDAYLEQAALSTYIMPLNQSVSDSFVNFYADIAEQGIDVWLTGANPTLGNAANYLRVSVTYYIINTTTGEIA